ncbi:reverse [Lasius niger]|uniref:Reverse n=1 Tax=Lasius niger TaxID=67767 RepID=A0A0J7KYG2_LASNI|nr:reverse [Lasius niger]
MSLEETASYLLEVHVPNDQILEDTPQQSALRENVLTAPDTADADWGVLPKTWKMGSLQAPLKSENKDEKDSKSYRPICLFSVIGKLFEKLIKFRLMDTSLAPGGVSDRQFGFISERSTEDAVVELRRMVSASEKRHAVALLFDISGAFDNV